MKMSRQNAIGLFLARRELAPAPHLVNDLVRIMRLARKHDRLAEMSCNGVGSINGRTYYAGRIDDYAKREYGSGVRSAYTVEGAEETIFDIESEKIEKKILDVCAADGIMADFQGDPRGYTVKLQWAGVDLTRVVLAKGR